jgi:hypothetical protein
MDRSVFLKGWLASPVLVVVLALGSEPLGAQAPSAPLNRPHFGLGYLSNAPDLLGGASGYVITGYRGLGLFLDAKFDYENPSSHDAFEPGLTATEVVNQVSGADFVSSESSYQSFNFGLAKALSTELILYVGGGFVMVSEYHLYDQPTSGLGVSGVFWVEAPAYDETRGNFMAGGFLRLSSFLSTQVGFESEPKGFTFGVSLRLPR